MPSPVVHSLAGLALNRFGRDQGWPGIRVALALVLAGNAADFDFIPGILIGEPGLFHHGPVHSLFAAALFGALSAPFGPALGFGSRRRGGVLMALAFASHLFLDMMAADDGRPSAVPLFWPLSDRMVTLPFTPFSAIRLDPGVDGFVQSLLSAHNANALMWEFGIVLLVVSLTSVARRARSQPARPPHTDPIRRTTRINPPRQYSE